LLQVTGGGSSGVYSLSSGRVAKLFSGGDDPLSESQYLAVAELQGGKAGTNDIIQLAAALTATAIKTYLSEEIQVGRAGMGQML
jgi:hypothetical protein